MKQFDALMQYWNDEMATIIPAGQSDEIIEWLKQQDADTWHQVVMSWNYDHGDKVLSWILKQDKCDRGTAAQVFMVEGIGHWLGEALQDPNKAQDPAHVCSLVLQNWSRYRTGELKPGYGKIPDWAQKAIRENGNLGLYANSPLQEITQFSGQRDAVSRYGSEDGKIVVDFEWWLQSKGIKITT